jgi:CRISPR-associated endonuclease/helicase Cas3
MTERFWAKTGTGEFINGSPQYHPVICHLADTAAVAMEIVRGYLSVAAVTSLEQGLGLQGEACIKFCGFLAGCHDLGKVSPIFQFQRSEIAKALAGPNLYDIWFNYLTPEERRGHAPHGTITAKTLPEFLIEAGLGSGLSGKKPLRLAQKLSVIVGGHHGFFPSLAEIENLDNLLCGTKENLYRPFSESIFKQLQDFVGVTTEDFPDRCNNAAAMILAGLTTVSDWIASNSDDATGFPYANDEQTFEEYAKGLQFKAANALKTIGWTKIPQDRSLEFTELFTSIKEPRPLQNAAIDLAPSLIPPCFILVEAAMGEGKTEAALYLADYLQHQSTAGGFYVGLPTQATSNAMWKRVKDFLEQRYPKEIVNLTLSHSAAVLKEEYRQTICRLDQVYDEDGKVVAAEWHTARKRTMLSPYGVGTVDQGLMGAVRSKHQFVRLFGLAGRTVILDEIHAYDLYTSTLLKCFLEWLAVLGSPVIALSATLPKDIRQQLVAAYAQGCGSVQQLKLPPAEYPRITAFTNGNLQVQSFAASEHVCRSLGLRWVKNDEQWLADLRDELLSGGCAAVICSTIGRAQKVFQLLQDYFEERELGLFHGRFLFVDRERIEQQCLTDFGKDSTDRPKRFVLVATQVIEQSLDVDFDLMISDMAPIDLILQRSGRLHRHDRKNRPTKVNQPKLWIIQPSYKKDGRADFAESEYIYDRHILLRTWLTLGQKTTIQLPAEMDALIESTYDLELPICQDLDSVHQQDWKASLAEYYQDEKLSKTAQANQVKLPSAIVDKDPEEFTKQAEENDDDQGIAKVTRLGSPSVTTIFLCKTANGLVFPDTKTVIKLNETPNLDEIRELLKYSTRISKKGLVETLLGQKNPSTWTSALLKYCRYLVLDESHCCQLGKWNLRLDPKLGVIISDR